jgi:hypothetical protein
VHVQGVPANRAKNGLAVAIHRKDPRSPFKAHLVYDRQKSFAKILGITPMTTIFTFKVDQDEALRSSRSL